MEEKELEHNDSLLNSGNTKDPEHAEVNEVEEKPTKTPRKSDSHKALFIILAGIGLCILAALIAVGISLALKSKFKDEPQLTFVPNPDDNSLISFEQGNVQTSDKYKVPVLNLMSTYELEKLQGDNFLDCQNLDEKPEDKPCVFFVDELGPECTSETNYGYNEGMPCVVLMFKKVEGWTPVPYNASIPPPDDSGFPSNFSWDRYSNHIPVTCEGQADADKENVGPIVIHPIGGFNNIFFPFKEKYADYRSPLVMVQFRKPKPGVLIQVECKAWAQNIDNKEGELGYVQISLLVD